jgi:hypothetical protein
MDMPLGAQKELTGGDVNPARSEKKWRGPDPGIRSQPIAELASLDGALGANVDLDLHLLTSFPLLYKQEGFASQTRRGFILKTMG